MPFILKQLDKLFDIYEKEKTKLEQFIDNERKNLERDQYSCYIMRETSKILFLVSKNRAEVLTIEKQISKKQKEIENITSVAEGASCPTYRQKLSIEHISKVKAEFYQEKLGLRSI